MKTYTGVAKRLRLLGLASGLVAILVGMMLLLPAVFSITVGAAPQGISFSRVMPADGNTLLVSRTASDNPLDPPTFQLKADIFIVNNSGTDREVESVTFSYPGPGIDDRTYTPVTFPDGVETPYTMAAGMEGRIAVYDGLDRDLPTPLPSIVRIEILFDGDPDPLGLNFWLAFRDNAVPLGAYFFPAKASDLEDGQYWIFGTRHVVDSGGGGSELNPSTRQQRYALDMEVVSWDGGGWSYTGGGNNSDHLVFELPIYAMEDGTIDTCYRGEADHKPGETTFDYFAGNSLRIQHGGDRILYAHFMLGTIPDDLCPADGLNKNLSIPVAAGQFLGRVGNTGRSSRPHLHIHATRDADDADGVPIQFLNARALGDDGTVNSLGDSPALQPFHRMASHRNSLILPNPCGFDPPASGFIEVSRHGIPAGCFQDVFNLIVARGYRPVFVDGYDIAGDTYFNATFGPAGPASDFRFGLTDSQFQDRFDELTADGFRLHQVDSYLYQGSVRYAAIFEKLSGPPFAAFKALGDSEYESQFAELADDGFVAVNISTVEIGGQLLWTGLFEQISVAGWTVHSVPEADYQAIFDDNVAAGRIPTYVNGFTAAGGPYVTAIFVDPAGAATSAVHGLSSEGYQLAWNENTGAGRLTRAVTGYDDGGGNAHFAAVWRALPKTIIPGKVIGQAVFGNLASNWSIGRGGKTVCEDIASGSLSNLRILTEQGEISLTVGPNTAITCPTGTARGIENARGGLPVRVAVLADRSPLDSQGVPTGEPAAALKISIIPSKATREHRRVVVSGKKDGNNVRVLDRQGTVIDLPDEAGEGLQIGDNLVVLVQRSAGAGRESRITAVVDAKAVAERLGRLVENEALESGDPSKRTRRTRLEALLERHQGDEGRARVSFDTTPGAAANPGPLPPVKVAGAPTLTIASPMEDTAVTEGSTLVVAVAHTGELSDLKVTVNGETLPETLDDPFVRTFDVPVTPLRERSPSRAQPNAFIGAAAVNGVPARDGTVVTAWVEVRRSSGLDIEVTATGLDGQTVTAHRAVDVIQLVKAGEATVKDKTYVLIVVQPIGEDFTGKTVRFRLDGLDAGQTRNWELGGAEVANLTARNLPVGSVTVTGASISIDPTLAQSGDLIMVSGTDFPSSASLSTLTIGGIDAMPAPAPATDANGNFTINVLVPGVTAGTQTVSAVAVGVTATTTLTVETAYANVPGGSISIDPASAQPGNVIMVSGTNFPSFSSVSLLTIGGTDARPVPAPATDANGNFTTNVLVPGVSAGTHNVSVAAGGVTGATPLTVEAAAAVAAPATNATEEVFADVIAADNLVRIWRFNNADQTWAFYDPRPAFESANTLTDASSGDIVWVNVNSEQEFQGQTLFPGWNLISLN